MSQTVLDGFRSTVPAGWTVTYAKGAEILTVGPDPEGAFFPDGQPRPNVVLPAPSDPGLLQEATTRDVVERSRRIVARALEAIDDAMQRDDARDAFAHSIVVGLG